MNKNLLFYLLIFLLPFASFAQDKNPPIFEDFAKGVKDCNTFAFNDHLNVMQLTTDNDKFDLVAVNDKMQTVWKTSLAGYGIGIDKFKDKIVALVATDHSMLKGTNNIYRAYMVEPQTGKIISDKIVYQSGVDYMEMPQMYTGNGDIFKLAVRQSAMKRTGTFGDYLVTSLTLGANIDTKGTRAIKVIDYNEKLDSVSAFKVPMSNGYFMSLAWNKSGDMFISWLNGPSIEIYKYDAGKTSPSNQMTVPVSLRSKSAFTTNLIHLQPAADRNVLYYALMYLNGDKDPELGVGKLDFAKGAKGYVTQVLNKSNLKALKKGFVPPNKDFDDVDFGMIDGMGIRFIEEFDGKLMIATASEVSSSGVKYQDNVLLNCYDANLNLSFQQILPTNIICVDSWPPIGYRSDGHRLRIVTNTKKGMASLQGVYAVMDMRTGKWERMEHLSKKHISDKDFIDGSTVLWFGDNFIAPYFTPRGTFKAKHDVTLQLNQ